MFQSNKRGKMMKARKSGFTLVEILIVVVILGILAAIVIPQFTDASTEAKESALCSDLQTMRSQIELYKIQHNDKAPDSAANFEAQMTGYTDVDGNVQAAAGPNIFGPYLQQVPTNQFNNLATLDNSGMAGDGLGGWEYNETTGAIHPDDNAAHALY
jgi:general secretion pathway protein G